MYHPRRRSCRYVVVGAATGVRAHLVAVLHRRVVAPRHVDRRRVDDRQNHIARRRGWRRAQRVRRLGGAGPRGVHDAVAHRALGLEAILPEACRGADARLDELRRHALRPASGRAATSPRGSSMRLPRPDVDVRAGVRPHDRHPRHRRRRRDGEGARAEHARGWCRPRPGAVDLTDRDDRVAVRRARSEPGVEICGHVRRGAPHQRAGDVRTGRAKHLEAGLLRRVVLQGQLDVVSVVATTETFDGATRAGGMQADADGADAVVVCPFTRTARTRIGSTRRTARHRCHGTR